MGRPRMHAGIFFGVDERGLIDVAAFRQRSTQCPRLTMRIQEFGDAMVLTGADKEIDFRHLALEILVVALREATRGDEHLALGAFLELRHIEDRLDRLLFRGLDERAGIDDDDFGVLGVWLMV